MKQSFLWGLSPLRWSRAFHCYHMYVRLRVSSWPRRMSMYLEAAPTSAPSTSLARVMANGVALSAGSYDVQLTAQSAIPETAGALSVLERWVEFRQGDDVRGREVVTIVPGSEISDVAKSAAPGSGSSRVEVLKEDEYIRVWINQSGTHYLIHLVVG